MWPEPGEALDRTVLAEEAIENLYAEALRRWAPTIRARLLPTFAVTAAADDPPEQQQLPADPNAATDAQAQSDWAAIAAVTIVAGITLLWAAATIEAMEALGIPTPEVPDDFDYTTVTPEPTVLAIVDKAVGDMKREEVLYAAAQVETSAPLRAARDTQVADTQLQALKAPAVVQAKVEAAARQAAPAPAQPDAITVTLTPAETTAAQRAAVEAAVDPAGTDMSDTAHEAGMQAAGVLNEAIITAAQQSEEADELQKFWIATLDSKTRPTHWAAEGQAVALSAHFTVGGEQMFAPGDETASPKEWKNCRCRCGIKHKDEPLPDEVDRHTERLDGRDSTAVNRDGRTQAEEIRRRADEGNIRARDDPDGIGRTAAGNWAASTEQETTVDDDTQQTFLTFSGYIGKLGVATSDRRIMAPDIDMTMREFPHPMAWQKQSVDNHRESYTVGVVEEAKIDGDRVWARGYFLNSPEAEEAADQVLHKVSAPSLDMAAAEYVFTDENGEEIEGDLFDWWEENGEPYAYFTKAEVTGFTLVQTPAFDGIDITLGERETRDLAVVASIVAAVDGPRVKTYDPALFEDPKFTQATRPSMDNKTGRIYGHLAEWGHVIRGGRELTPRNHNGYANFHTSQVQLDNGKQLSVGRLTVQGGHADTSAGVTVATARAHYDNVCTAFGLVRVGEDEFGIWFSGVAAPGVDPAVFQAGMTAPLSGDWRECPGTRGLDMIAAHAVNSPGFPIYSALTGPDGRDLALVACLGPSRKSKTAAGSFNMDSETLEALLVAAVETADRRRADQAAELANQERTDALVARAREAVGDPPAEPTPTDIVTQLLERV